jgi:hypothetical protein
VTNARLDCYLDFLVGTINLPYFTLRTIICAFRMSIISLMSLNTFYSLKLSTLVDLLIMLYTCVEFNDESLVFNEYIKFHMYMARGYRTR